MNVTDSAALEQILAAAPVLYLALHAEPAPHVVPVCFGMEGNVLYVHGAASGTKVDLMRTNPCVGFSACTEVRISMGTSACASSASARSVVGTGRARIVEDADERVRGLDAIMRHYGHSDPTRPAYRPQSLSRTCVIAIRIETLHGKSMGQVEELPPESR